MNEFFLKKDWRKNDRPKAKQLKGQIQKKCLFLNIYFMFIFKYLISVSSATRILDRPLPGYPFLIFIIKLSMLKELQKQLKFEIMVNKNKVF